jgi:CHAT domain-containing protein
MTNENNSKTLIPAFDKLFSAGSLSEGIEVIKAHPELLNYKTEELFEFAIKEAREKNNEANLRLFEQRHHFVKSAKQEIRQNSPLTAFQYDMQEARAKQNEYEKKGDLAPLSKAVLAWKRILEHSFFENTNEKFQLEVLNNSARTFLHCYIAMGSTEYIDNAIFCWKKTIDKMTEDSPYFFEILDNLGTGLFERYKSSTGNLEDLEESIAIFKRTVEESNQVPNSLARYLYNLGLGLVFRFELTGNFSDLQDSVNCLRKSVDKTQQNSDSLANRLSLLGGSLHTLFLYTGNTQYLEESIKVCRLAVEKTPVDSPSMPKCLDFLGIGLMSRYSFTGTIKDLEESIDKLRQAAIKTADTSVDLPITLNNLGNSLHYYYALHKDVNILDESISAFQKAIKKVSYGSPDFGTLLNNLSNSLRDKFLNTRNLKDLEEAINASTKAIQLTSDKNSKLPSFFNNLSNAFALYYEKTRTVGYLDKAIEVSQKAMEGILNNSPQYSTCCNNLATGYSNRFDAIGSFEDLQLAIEFYQKAAREGMHIAVEEGLRGSRNWQNWAFQRQAWEEVAQSNKYVYNLSEKLLQTQLLRHDKETWLREFQGLFAQAAYALTKNSKLSKAAITIEQGLARLLSEALALNRADLTALQNTEHAYLYNDYQTTVQRWEWAQQYKPDELKPARENLDKIIDTIRQVEGYENFLMPSGYTEIQAVATINTCVYIVITDTGGLALIVDKTHIKPVWLPELTEKVLIEKLKAYFENDYTNWLKAVTTKKVAYDALEKLNEDGKVTKEQLEKAQTVWQQAVTFEQNARANWEQTLTDTTHWLWQTVMSPIIDALPKQATVTLIPVGLLGLFPLHAAWTEDDTRKTGKRYALDELTIRYAPNARALKEAYALAQQVKADKLLAINNPSNDLPTSAPEVQSVRAMFTDSKGLSQQNATQNAVLNALPDYNVVHFSCHGRTNFQKPLESGLLMAHKQEITLADLLNRHLKVRLATLSACETGLSGTTLPDEVVSLPSGLLQAGVAGVVASLWSVSELSTMLLMSRFYYLWRQKQLEPIEALRQAQVWVRDSSYKERTAYLKEVLSPEQAKQVQKEMGFSDYSHPFHWAAFAYVGI